MTTRTQQPKVTTNVTLPPVDTTYQGWRNYETWAVNLWLTNDQANYMRLREILECWADNLADNQVVAAEIAAWVGEENPLYDDPSMFSDILAHALAQVDYLEIVKSNREE